MEFPELTPAAYIIFGIHHLRINASQKFRKALNRIIISLIKDRALHSCRNPNKQHSSYSQKQRNFYQSKSKLHLLHTIRIIT